jgi:hypothetical protein
VLIERWRDHYNRVRPRSSLGYRPPAPEAVGVAPAGLVLRLSDDGDHLVLRIEDDGQGFPDASGQSSGRGLQIMSYRARMIGGELRVGRRPGGGTIVNCFYRHRSVSEPRVFTHEPRR